MSEKIFLEVLPSLESSSFSEPEIVDYHQLAKSIYMNQAKVYRLDSDDGHCDFILRGNQHELACLGLKASDSEMGKNGVKMIIQLYKKYRQTHTNAKLIYIQHREGFARWLTMQGLALKILETIIQVEV